MNFCGKSCAPAGPMAKAAFPQRPWRTFAPSFYRFCSMRSAVNIPAPHRATCFIQKPAVSYQNHDPGGAGKAGNGVIPMPGPPAPGHSNSLLYGGLQLGRCAPLQWGDISLESGTIRIHKTMLRIQDLTPDARRKTKVLIDCPPKQSSNRVIPMPSFLMAFLKPHRMAKDVYLLTGKRAYMEPRICLEKYKRLLIRAGLDSFTFHTPCVTPLPPAAWKTALMSALSEILGHANVNTTLQRYPAVHHLKAGADESSGKYFHSGSKLWSDGSASSQSKNFRTSFYIVLL